MKEKIVIEVNPEDKLMIQLEALYWKKSIKDLIVFAVEEIKKIRIQSRKRVKWFDELILRAKEDYKAKGIEAPAMKKLSEVLAQINEKVTGKREWHWTEVNLQAWKNLISDVPLTPADSVVFSLDGEGWSPENVCKKLGLGISRFNGGNRAYYVANDYAEKFDVVEILSQIGDKK